MLFVVSSRTAQKAIENIESVGWPTKSTWVCECWCLQVIVTPLSQCLRSGAAKKCGHYRSFCPLSSTFKYFDKKLSTRFHFSIALDGIIQHTFRWSRVACWKWLTCSCVQWCVCCVRGAWFLPIIFCSGFCCELFFVFFQRASEILSTQQ